MRHLLIYIIFILGNTFFSQKLFAQLHWQEPVNMIELNSSSNEYAPSYNKYNNKLYFNSESSGQTFIYTSDFKDENFFAPVLLKGELNKKRSLKAYMTFIDAENAFISGYRQNSKYPIVNIFKTTFSRSQWTEPILYQDLKSDKFTSQITISPDNKFVVFVSSRNGDNTTDLWMGYLDNDGNCLSIAKLDEINSPGNEITPFLASKDTLYFASDGHEGPGGYDIFFSVLEHGRWGRPRLVENINTQFDESDFILFNDGDAIFASNRPGGLGGLDLYFAKRKITFKEADVQDKISLLISSQVNVIMANETYVYLLLPDENKPIEKGTSTIKLEPPLIELNLDSRPAFNKNFNISVFAGEKLIKTVTEEKIPGKYRIELYGFENKIFSSDSLVIVIADENKLFSERFKLNIIRSSYRERETFRQNNKTYDIYYIAFDDNESRFENYNLYIYNEIRTQAGAIGSVIIEYSKTGEQYVLANKLRDKLAKFPELSKQKFEIRQNDFNENIANTLSATIIRVLVERLY